MVHCIYQSVEEVQTGIFEVVKAYNSMLVRPPAMSDVKNKSQECFNCGEATHRGNSCPLVYGSSVRQLSNYSAVVIGGGGRGTVAVAVPSTSSSSASLFAPAPKPRPNVLPPVCFAWSNNGECNREKCPYPHPESRKAELGTCFNFRDRGVCHFGDRCKFQHITISAVAKPTIPAAASAVGKDDGFKIVEPKHKRSRKASSVDKEFGAAEERKEERKKEIEKRDSDVESEDEDGEIDESIDLDMTRNDQSKKRN
jgi:hypothetical protein